MAESVEHGYNNSVLLLGPRGCGKSMILEQVLAHLELQFKDRVSLVRLNGLLHADDRCALKEIAKQLCMDHHLVFSKTVTTT
jgi:origin recognition complex subunit 4